MPISNYDNALWAAADKYMSQGSELEGVHVTMTVERDMDKLPPQLRALSCFEPDDAACELKVECETGDAEAHVVAVVMGYKQKDFVVPFDCVIPLTEPESQWTYEVAIEVEELRRDTYEADEYDRYNDR
jgi:hypothetical protein